jgi:hypothetical protein
LNQIGFYLQKFSNKNRKENRKEKEQKTKKNHKRAKGEPFDPDKKSAHGPACTPGRNGIPSFLFLR